jgi:hypothetical protein
VKKTLVSSVRQQQLNHQLTVHLISLTALNPTATALDPTAIALDPTATALDRKTTAVRILLPTTLTTTATPYM